MTERVVAGVEDLPQDMPRHENVYIVKKKIQHTPLSLEENGTTLTILEARDPPLLPGAPGAQIQRLDERELHTDTHPVGDR